MDIAIRAADASDGRALIRLAELDSRPLPSGNLLVAETGGELRAALAVDTGELIADPFVRTAAIEALLRLRADQVGRRHAGRTRSPRELLSSLRLRTGRTG